jgi:hypothetical protein
MPSKFGDTNLGADCRGFYSAFYCCGECGKRDPGTQVGFFNDSVEMLVNTLDGPTVRPLGIDDFLQWPPRWARTPTRVERPF